MEQKCMEEHVHKFKARREGGNKARHGKHTKTSGKAVVKLSFED